LARAMLHIFFVESCFHSGSGWKKRSFTFKLMD
jgi:hypothetical protein